MTRAELAALLRLLVRTGRLGNRDAARFLSLFDAGSLTQSMLPLSISDWLGVITTVEATREYGSVAAVIRPISPAAATAFVNLAGTTIRTSTPPAVRKFLRVRVRNHFRSNFDLTMTGLAQQVSRTGDVQAWQGTMQRELRAYYVRQFTAGVGRPPTPAEIARLSQEAIKQQSYLQRFATEVSARQALGNPMSEAYLANRSNQYGAEGWKEWHVGNETAEVRGDGVGYVCIYRDRDDPSTCLPCSEAARNSPYLPGQGPMPGDVCRGGGNCRCTREVVFDMAAWQRLSGKRAA